MHMHAILLRGYICVLQGRQVQEHTWREVLVEFDSGLADLFICFEGDVSAHHVEEEDAQAPHSGLVAVVLAALDPLGRGIHASA